jgi:hypothetical protein
MIRSASLLFVLLFAACGNDAAVTPDAPVIMIDAPPIDALMCASPTKLCGTTCLAVTEDEENCGDCGVECHGGEACELTCACAPATFIQAMVMPGMFDQFQGGGSITLAIGPTFANGAINPFVVGYSATTMLNRNIDLSTIPLGEAPFVAAAYRFDLQTMSTDAAYTATAGTLRLTRACGTEVEGTLTDATFRGVTGGFTTPVIDPLGCTITVPSITFHIMTAACP